MSIQLESIVSEPFAENSYLVWRPGSQDAVIVDPGFEPDKIFAALKKHDLKLVMILNTHGHVDHIAGNAAMKERFPDSPLIIGHGDAAMLTDPFLNLSGQFGAPIVSPPADQLVKEGDVVDIAGFQWEVLEIPGHSPGHVVFIQRDGDGVTVLGGDVLFADGVGRTDFPGGSMEQLLSGIRNKLWPLPDAAKVYPGHGPATTIGQEKRSNPFLS